MTMTSLAAAVANHSGKIIKMALKEKKIIP